MRFVDRLRRAVQAMIPPVLFLLLASYFGWNAMRGDHGLRSYALRRQQLVTAQAELAAAQAERDAWEIRVAGLRANHIDPDTLDERARAMLNLADPNDVVVPYGEANKLY
jgi:cell division protein FtsB